MPTFKKPVVLPAAPTNTLEAATKGYVDGLTGTGGSKISALTTVSSPADADLVPIVDASTTKAITLNSLTAYFEQRGRQNNASVANQTPTGATDTYLVGSDVAIPAGRLQAKSRYRMVMYCQKTAAGAAAMVLAVRIGTAGSTADTARATITFALQTAAVDNGRVDLDVTFRTVGSGTSAVIRADALLDHQLAATGWTVLNSDVKGVASAGFDSTVANLKIGCSAIMGSATVATITSVAAELFNLA